MPEEVLTLIGVTDEGGGIVTYTFSPQNRITFSAGQYCHIRLTDMPPEAKSVREFSFLSAPHEEEIRFGIDTRSGSPYQRRLADMKPGDTATLFKIKGHMIWPPAEGLAVMIAGGIGVTPFYSMLLDRAHRGLSIQTRLIHAGSGGYAYAELISRLADSYEQTDRNKLFASLDAAVMSNIGARYYVAGSRGFVATVTAYLVKRGIAADEDIFKGLHHAEFPEAV